MVEATQKVMLTKKTYYITSSKPQKQDVKCDKCGTVAFSRPIEWKRKKHQNNIHCAKCSASRWKKGTRTRKPGEAK